jgi:alpha-glucosidase
MRAVDAPTTWVLSNHDVVRHVTRYGREQTGAFDSAQDMELPRPVDLELGGRRARAAALLMLALPGGAYVYQGEELGLEEVEDLPDEVLRDPVWERSGHTQRGRDGCRVPIPWSGDASPFGYGPEGSTPWLPQPAHWKELTVERQTGDPGSMLELYRSALRMRHEHPALGDGDMAWAESGEAVLAFTREPGFACWVNLGDDAVPLPAGEVLLASGPLADGALPTDTAAWLALDGYAHGDLEALLLCARQ